MRGQRDRGRPAHDDILTPGEWRVVEFVRHGLTNREIASRQGTSIDAVKFHVANALQKLGCTSRAELRRWNGVARHSALASHRRVQEEEGLAMGPIGQISRQVRDIEAARKWYENVLGLRHLYSFGDLAFFDCGGLRLFLSQSDDAGEGESIIYFSVPDIRFSQSELESRGVEFISAPHLVHRHSDGVEEWMAFFKDHEGRPLALMMQAGSDSSSKDA